MNSFLRYFGLLLVTLAFLCFLAVTRGRVEFPGQVGPRFDADISMVQREAILARHPLPRAGRGARGVYTRMLAEGLTPILP